VRAANLVIYLVDDDASVRRALTRLLKSISLDTVAFPSAEAFLQASPWVVEACLVLDVQLPGITGWELVDHLRATNITMPVIIITAYNDRQTQDHARNADIVAYLRKPFDDQELIVALQRVIDQRRVEPGHDH
jgi:FixJ family two-component response regulator